MRSVRRLLVAFYVALSSWLVCLAIADARDRKCNPDDTTECDFLANVLLLVNLLVLPALLIFLFLGLCTVTVGLLQDMNASVWVRQPPVVLVIGTVGLLAIVLAVAVFGNLEALL
jgi:hypothetical protein